MGMKVMAIILGLNLAEHVALFSEEAWLKRKFMFAKRRISVRLKMVRFQRVKNNYLDYRLICRACRLRTCKEVGMKSERKIRL